MNIFKHIAKFDHSLSKYLVAAIFLAVPLYPKFPFLEVSGTYVAIRLEDFLIAFSIFFFLVRLLSKRVSLKDAGLAGQAVILYFAIGLISTLSAIFITHSVVPHIAFLHYFRRIEYLSMLFLAASTIRKKEDLNFYLELVFWCAIVVFSFGIGQKYYGLPVVSTQNSEFSKGILLRLTPGARLNSTFAGHYDLAAFSVIVLPIFISLFLSQVTRYFKLLGVLGFSTTLWLLLSSSSRISFPAYLSAGLVVIFLHKRYKLIPLFILTSLILMATTTELASRYLRTVDVYFSQLSKYISLARKPPTEPPFQLEETPSPAETLPVVSGGVVTPGVVLPTVTPTPTPTRRPKIKKTSTPTTTPTPVIVEERSTAIRLNAEWPRAIRAFKKNPAFGTGFSSITLATDNDYLRLLGEIGALGALAFSLIFAAIYKDIKPTISQKHTSPLIYGVAGSIIGIMINATFIDVFEASKVAIPFWIIIGLLIGAARVHKNHQK